MTDIPEGLCCTHDNLWARQEPYGTVTVGLTPHAAKRLATIRRVHPPRIGRVLVAGTQAVTVDTVNGTHDYLAPVSGRVTAANADPARDPKSISDDPYGAWLFRLEPVVNLLSPSGTGRACP